jgi:hypothetical protein
MITRASVSTVELEPEDHLGAQNEKAVFVERDFEFAFKAHGQTTEIHRPTRLTVVCSRRRHARFALTGQTAR